MKVEARRLVGQTQSSASPRVILLYGDDFGLVSELGDQVTRAVAGSCDDPFRVTVLDREGHARVSEEVTALSMTGGRRVVRVRDVVDGLAPVVQMVADSRLDSTLLLEAPGLATKSRLRTLADRHEGIMSVACYSEEGRALESTITSLLKESNIAIEVDALKLAVSHLGADRALTRQEIEKLILYCGRQGVADIDAIHACIGDATAASLDDALFAATAGDFAGTDYALNQALAEGLSPVALVRAILAHLQRLYKASLMVASGQAVPDAMRAVRPPVFFRRQADFKRALQLWHPDRLAASLSDALMAEQQCKLTGHPDLAISARSLMAIAAWAARSSRRYDRVNNAMTPSS